MKSRKSFYDQIKNMKLNMVYCVMITKMRVFFFVCVCVKVNTYCFVAWKIYYNKYNYTQI